MMNLITAKRAALAAVGLLTLDGKEPPPSYNLQNDRLIRLSYWADSAQKELALTNVPIRRQIQYVTQRPKNLVAAPKSYTDSVKTCSNMTVRISAKGAMSFYVEVDGPCIIYVMVGETIVKKMKVDVPKGGFSPVRGHIENRNGEEASLILGGNGTYHYRREALYETEYEEQSEIPANCDYVKLSDIADDVFRVVKSEVRFEGNDGAEGKSYIEGNELYLSTEEDGVWDITYHAYPSDITDETEDSYEFEVPRYAHHAIVMKMAYGICVDMGFTNSSYAVFKNEHAQLFNAIAENQHAELKPVRNVY